MGEKDPPVCGVLTRFSDQGTRFAEGRSWGIQAPRWTSPAEMAARYGAETPVLDWRERLVCSRCGNRQVDIVALVKCARGPLLPPRVPGEGFNRTPPVSASLHGLRIGSMVRPSAG